jgi:hypothetical protein
MLTYRNSTDFNEMRRNLNDSDEMRCNLNDFDKVRRNLNDFDEVKCESKKDSVKDFAALCTSQQTLIVGLA